MTRVYKVLKKNVFTLEEYSLVPIRNEDKYQIMTWRNEQIDILRQNKLLTKGMQDQYFKKVIDELFLVDKPPQLLWSFLNRGELIGYGGLVHIDWNSGNAEISFLLETNRNNITDIFMRDWKYYLDMLCSIAFTELQYNKIYTYAYDIRENYFKVMLQCGFEQEARLKRHIKINDQLKDVLILSKFRETIK